MKKFLTATLLFIASFASAQTNSIVYGDPQYMERRTNSVVNAQQGADEYVFKSTATDGMYTIFYDQTRATIFQKGLLKNGHPIKFWNYYYPNQKPKSEYQYGSTGLIEGIASDYYESGTLKTKTTYLAGIATGPSATFNEQGVKIYECVYKEGLLNDRAITYDSNGNVLRVEEYNLGQLRK